MALDFGKLLSELYPPQQSPYVDANLAGRSRWVAGPGGNSVYPGMAVGGPQGVLPPSTALPATQLTPLQQMYQAQHAALSGQGQLGAAAEPLALGAGPGATTGVPITAGPIGGQVAGRALPAATPMQALGSPTPALEAGPGYTAIPSSGTPIAAGGPTGQLALPAGATPALEAGSPASAAGLGGNFAAPGATATGGLAEGAGAAGLGTALATAAAPSLPGFASLAHPMALAGQAKDAALGKVFNPETGLMEGGGVAAGAKAMLGRAPTGLGIYAGTQAAGMGLNALAPGEGVLQGLGGKAGGGDAVKDMGKYAALGFTVGGPAGALIGEGFGGVQAIGKTMGELSAAEAYDKTAGQFQKQINSKALSGTDAGDEFVKAAHQIHNADGLSIAQKNTAMSKLVGQMQTFRAQKKATKGQSAAGDSTALQRTAMQLMVADKMNQYGQNMVNASDAESQGLRNAMGSVDPMYQPMLEGEAVRNSAMARQMQGAYAGAALAQPMVDQMQAQLQQQQVLNQQMQLAAARAQAAAQSDTGSSGGGSFQDLLNPKKK